MSIENTDNIIRLLTQAYGSPKEIGFKFEEKGKKVPAYTGRSFEGTDWLGVYTHIRMLENRVVRPSEPIYMMSLAEPAQFTPRVMRANMTFSEFFAELMVKTPEELRIDGDWEDLL